MKNLHRFASTQAITHSQWNGINNINMDNTKTLSLWVQITLMTRCSWYNIMWWSLSVTKDSTSHWPCFCRWVMVFNATFNNISVISWRSVLLAEETRVSGENHRPFASHWQTLSHNVVSSTPRLSGIQTHNVSNDRHYQCYKGNITLVYKFKWETFKCYFEIN
jgi:hypothetical protein